MATRKTKSMSEERLDAVHYEQAIRLIEDGGTKKAACDILNIAYNTTRLTKLLEKYKEDKAKEAARRAEKRGKPASQAEIDFIVSSYLEGGTIDSISKSLYRGSTFVTSILNSLGVPIRQSAHDYFKPGLVPEAAMRDSFKVGEKVYSMRYDSLAKVDGEYSKGVYRLWLLSDKWQQYAYQPAEELASLEHLRNKGINI